MSSDRYLLESGFPDSYLLEDGSGVLLREESTPAESSETLSRIEHGEKVVPAVSLGGVLEE